MDPRAREPRTGGGGPASPAIDSLSVTSANPRVLGREACHARPGMGDGDATPMGHRPMTPEDGDTARISVLWLIKGLALGGAERLLVSFAGLADHRTFRYEAAYILPSL